MNKAIQKILNERTELRKPFAELKIELRTEKHFNVLEDLMEFTGLDEDEVTFRVLKKNPRHVKTKARGWFWDEWEWHEPASTREIDWFYMCSQSYLFSNARKTFWDPVGEYLNPKEHVQILDYGCGVGTNVLGLVERKFERISYYDIGLLQQKFVEFRTRKRRFLQNTVSVGGPWDRSTHDFCEIYGGYCAIILHDVLEHVPNYERLLGGLIKILRVGGVIIERSAFSEKERLPFHLPEKVPIKVAMKGMELIAGDRRVARLWRKGK